MLAAQLFAAADVRPLLARRFRASFCATLRVALLEPRGRTRLSERTLARRNLALRDAICEGTVRQPCCRARAQSRGLVTTSKCAFRTAIRTGLEHLECAFASNAVPRAATRDQIVSHRNRVRVVAQHAMTLSSD